MKYFTLPGYGGSSAEHWQTYFEKSLPNCERIEQADWDKPNCEKWVKTLETKITACKDEEIILIAHSLGCITLAHWVNRFQKKVKAALLVAPPDLENQNHGFQSFTPTPLDRLPFKTILVASDNDPWSTKEQSEKLARNWGSRFILLENAGHVNADSGFGKWEQGIELVNELSAD
ncbi:RBBP9/YdeN family alpha/beta hydrolase [Mangrovibacterium lignilyticum]|uniref:RBBP9/YdeN family alpha/beta hydrolase n=1 Tax=Mangrovibacterium lignilyticum TaxID=2668052 RepID=UPI0013CFD2FD|nr:alpha/beta hydrolase [Mangrovibacterium lignilyticum]